MKITVARYNPDTKKRWLQVYDIDVSHSSMTVMDVLQKISDDQDQSLAFYRHSMCNHGICGRCILCVNGKPKLACVDLIDNYKGQDLLLEPMNNFKVVRDLVIEQENPFLHSEISTIKKGE